MKASVSQSLLQNSRSEWG